MTKEKQIVTEVSQILSQIYNTLHNATLHSRQWYLDIFNAKNPVLLHVTEQLQRPPQEQVGVSRLKMAAVYIFPPNFFRPKISCCATKRGR